MVAECAKLAIDITQGLAEDVQTSDRKFTVEARDDLPVSALNPERYLANV